MKKSGVIALLMLTVLFVGFICGFFIGRNTGHSEVEISLLHPGNKESQLPSAGASTTIPAVTDPQGSVVANPSSGIPDRKVNINTADKDALMTLPGIGEVLAERILDYRAANGPFTSLSDLMMVEGIGEKRMDAIWDYITLGG